jgi:hypothetical protein
MSNKRGNPRQESLNKKLYKVRNDEFIVLAAATYLPNSIHSNNQRYRKLDIVAQIHRLLFTTFDI